MGFYKGVHNASIYGAYTVGVCFKGLDTEKYWDVTARRTVQHLTAPPTAILLVLPTVHTVHPPRASHSPTFTYPYLQINLQPSLPHTYCKLNLQPSLPHTYCKLNLQPSLSHTYCKLNLQPSLSHTHCSTPSPTPTAQPTVSTYINTVTPGLSGLELSRKLIYPTINSATLTNSMYTNLPHLSSNLCYLTSILATNCVG